MSGGRNVSVGPTTSNQVLPSISTLININNYSTKGKGIGETQTFTTNPSVTSPNNNTQSFTSFTVKQNVNPAKEQTPIKKLKPNKESKNENTGDQKKKKSVTNSKTTISHPENTPQFPNIQSPYSHSQIHSQPGSIHSLQYPNALAGIQSPTNNQSNGLNHNPQTLSSQSLNQLPTVQLQHIPPIHSAQTQQLTPLPQIPQQNQSQPASLSHFASPSSLIHTPQSTPNAQSTQNILNTPKEQLPNVVDFNKLDIPALKRYKKQFKLHTKQNSTKAELVSAITKHFVSQEVKESEIIAFFIYTVKNQEKMLRLKEPPQRVNI